MKEEKKIDSGIVRELFGKLKSGGLSRNYRRITAIIISLSLISLISLVSLDLARNWQAKQRIEQERKRITSDIEHWQQILIKYPNYRDAYFKLAGLEYQLKNLGKASEYLQKALELDPNFEPARKLEILLGAELLKLRIKK